MSPDGRWLLGVDDELDRVCGFEIPTAMIHECVDVRTAEFFGPVEHSIAWSPDGTRVAMTEDGLMRLFESDIWLFEVETGRLANLTDDGVSGSVLRPEGEGTAVADLFPTWSPDGQMIAFARTVRGEGSLADAEGGIYQVDAGGSTPEEIAPLPAPGAYAVYPELRWSADGRSLAYSLVLYNDRNDPANGLWVVDVDGANQREVPTGDLTRPLLMDLSARGAALVASADYLDNMQAYAGPRFATVDLATGSMTSLDDVPAPLWGAPMLLMAAFSRDGGQLVYVNLKPSRERQLLVYDFDREEAVALVDPIDAWLGGADPAGMVWGRDDVIFVPGFGGTAILVQLDGNREQ